jgi:hypothetical protein
MKQWKRKSEHERDPLRVFFRWRVPEEERHTCYDCGDHIPEEIPNYRVPFATQTETSLIVRIEPLCVICAGLEQLNPRYD